MNLQITYCRNVNSGIHVWETVLHLQCTYWMGTWFVSLLLYLLHFVCICLSFTICLTVKTVNGTVYQSGLHWLQYEAAVSLVFAVAQSLKHLEIQDGHRECTHIKRNAKRLHWLILVPYIKHTQLVCSSSLNPGFRECKLACLCTSSTSRCLIITDCPVTPL